MVRAVPPGLNTGSSSSHSQQSPQVVRLASLLSVVTCISKVSDTLRDFNYYFAYTPAYSV